MKKGEPTRADIPVRFHIIFGYSFVRTLRNSTPPFPSLNPAVIAVLRISIGFHEFPATPPHACSYAPWSLMSCLSLPKSSKIHGNFGDSGVMNRGKVFGVPLGGLSLYPNRQTPPQLEPRKGPVLGW